MVEVGDKIVFTKGPYGKKRNSWAVKYVGGGAKNRRFVFVAKPLNKLHVWQYLVIDTMFQVYDPDWHRMPMNLVAESDDPWKAVADDYCTGLREIPWRKKRPLTDCEGLND